MTFFDTAEVSGPFTNEEVVGEAPLPFAVIAGARRLPARMAHPRTRPTISLGRSALVTGAAMGIGLARARTFAQSGAAVVLVDIDGTLAGSGLPRPRGVRSG